MAGRGGAWQKVSPKLHRKLFFFFKSRWPGPVWSHDPTSLVITVMSLSFPPVHVGIMGWEE